MIMKPKQKTSVLITFREHWDLLFCKIVIKEKKCYPAFIIHTVSQTNQIMRETFP